MGTVATITKDRWPMQGSLIGERVRVCFHYDTKAAIEAVCVRDDIEAPWETIFRLDDGRIVLSGECQYSTSPASAS